MPSPSNIRTAGSLEAQQLVWAIAFDDDDIAHFLSCMAVVCLVNAFYAPMEKKYPDYMRARVAALSGTVRAQCILAEAEMDKRMTEYSTLLKDPEADIPF